MTEFVFPFHYPTIADAIAAHEQAMEISGDVVQGANPDAIALFEASLDLIKIVDFYRSFDEKLTHLFFSACKAHAFVEGNKRFTVALCAKFLTDNGFGHRATRFMRYMENVVVCVADNKIDKAFLGQIMIAFLSGEEEEEEIKLRILEAVEQVRLDQEQRDAENQPPA